LTGSVSNFSSFIYNMVGYYSSTGDFALPGSETTYDYNPPFMDPTWSFYYNTLFDLTLAKRKAMANGDSVLTGASMILLAKIWQDVVDMFGDVPFSEAFENDITRKPRYDKASDIYNSLEKSLDTAIEFMGASPNSTFSSTDIVNHGDQGKWKKFANTLRLRLLIRQSEVAGFDPSAEITKIINDGGVLHAGESANVNPGYDNETNKQNPYYGSWAFSPTGGDAAPGERANVYIVNLLKSNNDPRLTRIFSPVNGSVVGCEYGLASGNPTAPQASKAGPGIAGNPSQDQWIIPSFESMFLEAEAIARGWMPGDAQAAYVNAVTESFAWLGVPDPVNAAADYISNNAIANWSNSGTTALEKARFIATQKYIAMTVIDPLEAWNDIRRLGILPDKGYLSVNPAKVSNTLPARYPYAQSEYVTNSENVNIAAGNGNIFTSKIFWQT